MYKRRNKKYNNLILYANTTEEIDKILNNAINSYRDYHYELTYNK